jgi:hypothetical protein
VQSALASIPTLRSGAASLSEPTKLWLPKVKLDAIERSRAIGRVVETLEELPHNQDWRVEVEEMKSQRRTVANAYYWGVVLPLISDATGFETEELHEYFLGSHFGWKDKPIPKTPRNPLGIESTPRRSTTKDEKGRRSVLGIAKFYDFVEFVRRFAAIKLSLNIPDPDPEYKAHREKAYLVRETAHARRADDMLSEQEKAA